MGEALVAIAAATQAEGGAWADLLLADAGRAAVEPWAPLCGACFAPGLEAIYEGHLLHAGRARLFAADDRDAALLCGDYLYAQGLVWVTERHDVDAVRALAELIALAARGRGEAGADDGFALWAATALYLADRALAGPLTAARERLRAEGDSEPLERLLEAPSAPREAVAAARAAHYALVGSTGD